MILLLNEGQVSDYKSAALMFDAVCQGRAWGCCLHQVWLESKNSYDARRRALPPAPRDQEHVRQGLVSHLELL